VILHPTSEHGAKDTSKFSLLATRQERSGTFFLGRSDRPALALVCLDQHRQDLEAVMLRGAGLGLPEVFDRRERFGVAGQKPGRIEG
jgi:hypothetical protein